MTPFIGPGLSRTGSPWPNPGGDARHGDAALSRPRVVPACASWVTVLPWAISCSAVHCFAEAFVLELADDLFRCGPGAFHGGVPGPAWPAEDSPSPWTGFRGPRHLECLCVILASYVIRIRPSAMGSPIGIYGFRGWNVPSRRSLVASLLWRRICQADGAVGRAWLPVLLGWREVPEEQYSCTPGASAAVGRSWAAARADQPAAKRGCPPQQGPAG